MSKFWPLSSIAALLAIWVVYNGRSAYNLLAPAPLPGSYFVGGNSSCKTIKHKYSDRLKFCEDLTPWTTLDTAGNEIHRIIASCDPGRYEWNTVMGPLLDPEPKGNLWVLNPDAEDLNPQLLTLQNFNSTHDFHPLGIDIFTGAANEPSTLFVINHMRDSKRTVEVFELYDESPPRLVHVRQLYHPMFWAPNSVAALSHKDFFLSIDHWFKRDGLWPWKLFMPVVESALMLPLGMVEYVQFGPTGINVTVPAIGVPFANGLALSKDGSKLAVASTSACKVKVYEVSEEGLKLKDTINLPFSPDNMGYEQDGSLIVAGHPHFPSIVRYSKRKQAIAPSWVVSISDRIQSLQDDTDLQAPYSVYNRTNTHDRYAVKTLYQSDGSGWSASSTALWSNKKQDKLIVSGLYSEGILVC
ncbi:hypothetical protein CPB86DRAFT_742801 [Serendipita vermifera]|nr:hypothetical protein CPB86DRAFT_742801 [Serendipita vermifera]